MKKRKFTPLQQKVYDAVMSGKVMIVSWPIGAGKTYLHNAIKEDVAEIKKAIASQFEDEV